MAVVSLETVVPEAPLEETEHGLVPAGEGWFVVNARKALWKDVDGLGPWVAFEGEEARFADLGINITLLRPGQPACMYHAEEAQEGFLVLAGECLLLVEGEERQLRAWDFFHCPPWTEHVLVGAGDGPCLVLGVGARGKEGLVYPVRDVALKHDAGVFEETSDGKTAYARFPEPVSASCPVDFRG
jgi:uncharacterized cupin superfamily protein